MAINPVSTFPTTLDSIEDPGVTDKQDDTDIEHDLLHQKENDAIENIQTKVGIDSSAVTTSHDYKLSGVTGSDKSASLTGTETLTNKTLTTPKLNEAVNLTATSTELNLLAGTSLSSVYLEALLTGWISAGETWTYSSVDDPTGIFTVTGDVTGKYGKGMYIKFVNGENTIYGKISKAPSYSSPNTTITFCHEIDPGTNAALTAMADSSITSNYYSRDKAPLDFPVEKNKWSLLTTTGSTSQSSPTQNVWYNLGGNLVVHIGDWRLYYIGSAYIDDTSSTYAADVISTLSTANNSESDSTMSVLAYKISGTAATTSGGATAYKERFLSLTAKSTRYLNAKTTLAGVNTVNLGFSTGSIIVAELAL